jgi:aromatic-L-amino-acid decarboxylase
MHPDEFRRHGHQIVDWIADFLAAPEKHPVLPNVQPGELIDSLPPAGPECGEPMDRILADFDRFIIPGIAHWNHPDFFAYFATSTSGPGILAEALAATLNVNHMLWKSSPAATELEQVTVDWLRQWMGLPSGLFGEILDTASTSTMHAIAAAREAADPDCRTRGGSQDLVLYTSEHAHSSVEKGAMAVGIGQNNVRKIPLDEEFRMRPEALSEAIERDKAAGLRPFCVVATVGTTSTTAIDPVAGIAGVAERHGLWMHVDAAYGGSAALVPELQARIVDGCDRADSLVVNPHKWLLTPMDASVFYTRRPDILRRAFSLVPDYLHTQEHPRAVNLMEYGVPLGRRFRSLKLWFVFRYYGRKGIAGMIRNHISLAQELASWIEASPRFELAAPTPLSLVCFRFRGTDDDNQRLIERVNATGKAFLGPATLRGRLVVRFAIGNVNTGREHIARAWGIIQQSV